MGKRGVGEKKCRGLVIFLASFRILKGEGAGGHCALPPSQSLKRVKFFVFLCVCVCEV